MLAGTTWTARKKRKYNTIYAVILNPFQEIYKKKKNHIFISSFGHCVRMLEFCETTKRKRKKKKQNLKRRRIKLKTETTENHHDSFEML